MIKDRNTLEYIFTCLTNVKIYLKYEEFLN